MDDFILFSNEKKQLWEWKRRISDYLQTLALLMHAGAHVKPVSEGLPFLGFVVYPDRRRVKRRKVVYYRRKIKVLVQQVKSDKVELARLSHSIQSWANHLHDGNTFGLRQKLLSSIVI